MLSSGILLAGEIKARVILIFNEMPDRNTDENTIQPTYKLTTCFRVRDWSFSMAGIGVEENCFSG